MRRPYIYVVIGKNFGDEGKGLAVDYLAMQNPEERTLVIRHNGGAQSGHTVDLPEKRFVFHELSSGSFRGADTLWADTYFPDLYKLGEELEDFRALAGFVPRIYAQPGAQITLIDDVLLNMAAEEARGATRHGSCGMGIYEAQLRGEAGFAITLDELIRMNRAELVERLQEIRAKYLPDRLQALNLSKGSLGEYGELLKDTNVLINVATQILENLDYVQPVENMAQFMNGYEQVIFENGQGLLLDSENETFTPHVTASRTGLHHPCAFLKRYDLWPDEVIYVTRSFVTRHGAGPLPYECSREELVIIQPDATNVENPWQGRLRFARHGTVEEFVLPVTEDLQVLKEYQMPMPCRSLMITHLNETGGSIVMQDQECPVEEFCRNTRIKQHFDKFYLSASPYATGLEVINSWEECLLGNCDMS